MVGYPRLRYLIIYNSKGSAAGFTYLIANRRPSLTYLMPNGFVGIGCAGRLFLAILARLRKLRKITGKWLENSRQIVGKWSDNDRKTVGKWSENGWKIVGKWSDNDRNMVGK